MGQNYDTGGALRRPSEAPAGTGTLFGQTMGLAAVTAGLILLVFVSIPGGSVVYALLGLVIFAGLVMYDFQRLRVRNEIDSAPLLAASIFLDILNVFQVFLSLRSESQLTAQTAPRTTRRT
jgi:FtsH-binding integral membrane protein